MTNKKYIIIGGLISLLFIIGSLMYKSHKNAIAIKKRNRLKQRAATMANDSYDKNIQPHLNIEIKPE